MGIPVLALSFVEEVWSKTHLGTIDLSQVSSLSSSLDLYLFNA